MDRERVGGGIAASVPHAQLSAGGVRPCWWHRRVPRLAAHCALPEPEGPGAVHATRPGGHLGKRHKSHCFGRLDELPGRRQ